jgi:hypothetical protein
MPRESSTPEPHRCARQGNGSPSLIFRSCGRYGHNRTEEFDLIGASNLKDFSGKSAAISTGTVRALRGSKSTKLAEVEAV